MSRISFTTADRYAIQNMVRRVRLTEVNDDGPQQIITATGRGGEIIEAHRIQPFGFASTPPAGSHGIIASLGGDGSKSVVLGVESPGDRVTIASGGQAIYDASGQVFSMVGGTTKLTTGGSVTIEASSVTIKAGSITIEGGSVDLNGAVKINGILQSGS